MPRVPRALLIALAAFFLAAPAAEACTDQSLSKPFLPWLDFANYQAAPDGGLEAGAAGWTLNGASVVTGGQPFGAVIGTGAWAPTLPMLVVLNLLGEQDVRFRFASGLGSFRIDNVYIDPYSKG